MSQSCVLRRVQPAWSYGTLPLTLPALGTTWRQPKVNRKQKRKETSKQVICLSRFKIHISFQSHLENNPYSFLRERATHGYPLSSHQPSWIPSHRKSPNSSPPQNSDPALPLTEGRLVLLILLYLPLIPFMHKHKHCFLRGAFYNHFFESGLLPITAVLITFYYLLLDLPWTLVKVIINA